MSFFWTLLPLALLTFTNTSRSLFFHIRLTELIPLDSHEEYPYDFLLLSF